MTRWKKGRSQEQCEETFSIIKELDVKIKNVHSKLYRYLNKKELTIKKDSRRICECGADVRTDNYVRHVKTKSHMEIIEKRLL